MATFGGFDFTGLRGVNLKNTAAIRFEGDGGLASTLRFQSSPYASRAHTLPDRSGILPVAGTFALNLPAVSGFTETAVTISGMTREDIVSVTIRDMGNTVTTSRGFPVLIGARPESGYLYLTFASTGTASLYADLVMSYVVAR